MLPFEGFKKIYIQLIYFYRRLNIATDIAEAVNSQLLITAEGLAELACIVGISEQSMKLCSAVMLASPTEPTAHLNGL